MLQRNIALFAVIIIVIIVIAVIGFAMFFVPKYTHIIDECGLELGVDSDLIMAIIKAESGFDRFAVSPKGATGLMQLMPSTAEWVTERTGYKNNYSLTDAVDNINIGVAYMAYLMNKYNSVDLVVIAYNAGEGNVDNWLLLSGGGDLRIEYGETRTYYERVMRYYNCYKVLKT